MGISGECFMKALHTREGVNVHIRPCSGAMAGPPVSRHANAASNALASCQGFAQDTCNLALN